MIYDNGFLDSSKHLSCIICQYKRNELIKGQKEKKPSYSYLLSSSMSINKYSECPVSIIVQTTRHQGLSLLVSFDFFGFFFLNNSLLVILNDFVTLDQIKTNRRNKFKNNILLIYMTM
jgi:hypothetical protein